jgi:hypothetical protein
VTKLLTMSFRTVLLLATLAMLACAVHGVGQERRQRRPGVEGEFFDVSNHAVISSELKCNRYIRQLGAGCRGEAILPPFIVEHILRYDAQACITTNAARTASPLPCAPILNAPNATAQLCESTAPFDNRINHLQ